MGWMPEMTYVARRVESRDFLPLSNICKRNGRENLPAHIRQSISRPCFGCVVAIVPKESEVFGGLIFEAMTDGFRLDNLIIEYASDVYREVLETMIDAIIGLTCSNAPKITVPIRSDSPDTIKDFRRLGFRKYASLVGGTYQDDVGTYLYEWRLSTPNKIDPKMRGVFYK